MTGRVPRLRRWVARLGDAHVEVEVRAEPGGRIRYRVGDREGEAEVRHLPHSGALLLEQEGRILAVEVQREGSRFEARAPGGALSGDLFPEDRFLVATMQGGLGDRDGSVVASMPGRVVRVLVEEGDLVLEGQGLVILEAMKMENEVRAPRAGRIRRIGVGENLSVEAGTLLVEIVDDQA